MLNKIKKFKDLRSQAKTLQSKLAEETITVKAAGDKIVLTLDGNMTLVGLAIDDEMMSPGKKDALQEGIKKAHADATKKMQRVLAMKMKEMGGIPDFSGLMGKQ